MKFNKGLIVDQRTSETLRKIQMEIGITVTFEDNQRPIGPYSLKLTPTDALERFGIPLPCTVTLSSPCSSTLKDPNILQRIVRNIARDC